MEDFDAFVARVEPELRRAFVAAYGPTDGRDAAAEALAYAWEHWDRVRNLENGAGYLFRVGQSRSRRRRAGHLVAVEGVDAIPDVDPRLRPALAQLSEQQRVAVFLVHGCGWPHGDVAAFLGCAPSTVSTHVQRGVARLRAMLEVGARA